MKRTNDMDTQTRDNMLDQRTITVPPSDETSTRDICIVCRDPHELARRTCAPPCSHACCTTCRQELERRRMNTCPFCRKGYYVRTRGIKRTSLTPDHVDETIRSRDSRPRLGRKVSVGVITFWVVAHILRTAFVAR